MRLSSPPLVTCWWKRFISEEACMRMASGQWRMGGDERGSRRETRAVSAVRTEEEEQTGTRRRRRREEWMCRLRSSFISRSRTHTRSSPPSCTVCLRPYRPLLPLSASPSDLSLFPLPSASASIVLARVSCLHSSPFRHYDAAITAFFRQRRVLCQHQIIAVPLRGRQRTFLHASYDERKDKKEEEDWRQQGEVEEEDEDQDADDSAIAAATAVDAAPGVVFFQISSPSSSSSSSAPFIVVEPGVTSIMTEGSIHSTAPYVGGAIRGEEEEKFGCFVCFPSAACGCIAAIAPAGVAGVLCCRRCRRRHRPSRFCWWRLHTRLRRRCCPRCRFVASALLPALPLHPPDSHCSTFPSAASSPFSSVLSSITSSRPCLLHLQQLSALTKAKDRQRDVAAFISSLLSSQPEGRGEGRVVIVGECESVEEVGVTVRAVFSHQYEMGVPNKEEREEVVVEVLKALEEEDERGSGGGAAGVGGLEEDDRTEMARVIAGKSAGVSVGELVGVVQEGVRLGRRRWMEEERKRKEEFTTEGQTVRLSLVDFRLPPYLPSRLSHSSSSPSVYAA